MTVYDHFKSLDDFLTVEEASSKWDVSARWIRTLCTRGLLEADKIGSRWVIVKDQTYPEFDK